MSLEHAIEEIIQQAMARGEFDNLPGKGKPLDLDSYFAVPDDLRMSYAMLKNAGFLPEEVQLLHEVGQLRARLSSTTSAQHRQQLEREINARRLQFDLMMERYRMGRRRR